MSETEWQEALDPRSSDTDDTGFRDISINCIDCSEQFIWSAGEQAFFRQKELGNPPKRCKPCKRAKNRRLDAIEASRITGRRQRVEVPAACAQCGETTTVPFFPCQGRPVYCRKCFQNQRPERVSSAAG